MCAAALIAAGIAAAAPAPLDAEAAAAARPALEARFARMDRDGDGFVAANEAPRAAQARCGGTGKDSGGWIGARDGDGDGRVSREEFLAASLPVRMAGSASAAAPR